MSYEAWRREVAMGRMSDWNEERNDYDPPPQPETGMKSYKPSGKFPEVETIPEKLKEDK